jgi:hypothetical protein
MMLLGFGQRIFPPEPTKGIGKDGSAMVSIMASSAVNEFYVVITEFESSVHLFVGQRPIAVLVIKISAAVLEEYAQGFGVAAFSDECRVVVASANVGKAADVAEHFAELIGAFPGYCESADASTAIAADCSSVRVAGDVVGFGDFR